MVCSERVGSGRISGLSHSACRMRAARCRCCDRRYPSELKSHRRFRQPLLARRTSTATRECEPAPPGAPHARPPSRERRRHRSCRPERPCRVATRREWRAMAVCTCWSPAPRARASRRRSSSPRQHRFDALNVASHGDTIRDATAHICVSRRAFEREPSVGRTDARHSPRRRRRARRGTSHSSRSAFALRQCGSRKCVL